MTDAIVATVESHMLAPVVPESKMQILGDVIAPGLSRAQLDVFAVACNRTRLDPFAKQICAITRWDSELGRNKMTIQTTIDGFRIIAERTGKYGGRLPFEWCGKDGVWREVWLEDAPPAAARVRVVRKDWAEPIVAIARYKAYVQTKKGGDVTAMWRKMDAEQLAKCAEALGLRTAFPQELSGLYTDDEMAQASNGDDPKPEPKREERKSSPPPGASVGPCFARSFPDANYASKPLSMASLEILEDYRLWLVALLKDESRARLHKQAKQSLDEAMAEVDRRIAQQSQPDPIADALQKSTERPREDETMPDGWGLEAPQ